MFLSRFFSSVGDRKSLDVFQTGAPPATSHWVIATLPTPRGPVLKFKRLTEHAFAPTKGSEMAAGYDLKSAYDVIVPAEGKALVKTDIQI